VRTVWCVCSFVQHMTRLFPVSETFEFQGRNVYAGQVVDVDDEVELRHNYTSDVTGLPVTSAQSLHHSQ